MKQDLFKKILAYSLIVFIMISATGCRNQENSQSIITPSFKKNQTATSEITTLTLPYTYDDPLNPYTAQSVNNLTIMPLLYDGLIKINPDYKIEPLIAQDYSLESKKITFTIKENAKFSDGSDITATDVIYSFNKAKASNTYLSKLSNIKSVSGSSNSVAIELNSPNSNFLYLADIPIVKNNSAEKNMQPLGCGRYTISQNGSEKVLQYNENYYNKKTVKFKQINLSYSPSVDTTESGIKAATLNLAYRGTLENTMGGAGTVSVPTPLPHLVYVGFNGAGGLTSNEKFRRAFYEAIDKQNFLKSVYADNGVLTSLPIYPKIYDQSSDSTATNNKSKANELLDELGFTQRDQYQNRLQGGVPIAIDLLVPKDSSYKNTAANKIKSMLKPYGITVNLILVDNDTFNAKIKSGDFSAYIGEIIQQNDTSLSPFLPGGSVSAGLPFSQNLINSYDALMENSNSYNDFEKLFLEEMPIAPICYRNGILVVSNNLKSDIIPCVNDNFYNIEDWQ